MIIDHSNWLAGILGNMSATGQGLQQMEGEDLKQQQQKQSMQLAQQQEERARQTFDFNLQESKAEAERRAKEFEQRATTEQLRQDALRKSNAAADEKKTQDEARRKAIIGRWSSTNFHAPEYGPSGGVDVSRRKRFKAIMDNAGQMNPDDLEQQFGQWDQDARQYGAQGYRDNVMWGLTSLADSADFKAITATNRGRPLLDELQALVVGLSSGQIDGMQGSQQVAALRQKAAMLSALGAYQRGFAGRKATIHYAMKANSSLAVLQVFAQAGCGFDIVSGGELERVLAAGGQAAKVIFSGVGKTPREMRRAWMTAFGNARLANRDTLEVADLPAANGARQRMGFLG